LFETLVIDLFHTKDYNEETDEKLKRYVLQIVDHKSKFRFTYVIPKKKPQYAIDNLHHLFSIIGPPHTIQSDNGTEFVNREMIELAALWNCSHITSSARHPQTNGVVERANGVLKKLIRTWKKKNRGKSCASFLPIIVHQLNITKHDTIGISPYEYAFLVRSWKSEMMMNPRPHPTQLY
jgi:transposase InsO family protein